MRPIFYFAMNRSILDLENAVGLACELQGAVALLGGRHVPLTVTTRFEVSILRSRALTLSSSAIFALILAVRAPSSSTSLACGPATFARSAADSPRSFDRLTLAGPVRGTPPAEIEAGCHGYDDEQDDELEKGSEHSYLRFTLGSPADLVPEVRVLRPGDNSVRFRIRLRHCSPVGKIGGVRELQDCSVVDCRRCSPRGHRLPGGARLPSAHAHDLQSPDGRFYAFVRQHLNPDPPDDHLYVGPFGGPAHHVLALAPDADWCRTIIWTPDSQTVGFLVSEQRLALVNARTMS